MNKKPPILFILLFSIQVVVYSQTIISGKIVNRMNKALPDVSIMLMTVKDSSIIAYSNTDNAGTYKINTARNDPELLISISSFGIKRQIKRIKNNSQTINFSAEESNGMELREVVVKAVLYVTIMI